MAVFRALIDMDKERWVEGVCYVCQVVDCSSMTLMLMHDEGSKQGHKLLASCQARLPAMPPSISTPYAARPNVCRGRYTLAPVDGGPRPLPVTVRRGFILEDALQQLPRGEEGLKGRIHVTFINEQGVQASRGAMLGRLLRLGPGCSAWGAPLLLCEGARLT